jgi:hypothetical protein
MNKIAKIFALALVINCSGFVTTEINAEECSKHERQNRTPKEKLKEKLKNTLLGGVIGFGTGAVTGIADTLFIRTFCNEFPFYLLFPWASWNIEIETRKELISDIDCDSKIISNTAWIASWIGYLTTQAFIMKLPRTSASRKTVSTEPVQQTS